VPNTILPGHDLRKSPHLRVRELAAAHVIRWMRSRGAMAAIQEVAVSALPRRCRASVVVMGRWGSRWSSRAGDVVGISLPRTAPDILQHMPSRPPCTLLMNASVLARILVVPSRCDVGASDLRAHPHSLPGGAIGGACRSPWESATSNRVRFDSLVRFS